jgi:hypothetical protein
MIALHPKYRRGPVGDPNAIALGGSSPSLGSVNANQQDIVINGLPASYAGLTTGSYLSFQYDSGRQAFHQVAQGANASAGGAASVSVVPAIRPGYSGGAPVKIVDPVVYAVIKPDSFRPARFLSGYASGITFDWRQTLGRP